MRKLMKHAAPLALALILLLGLLPGSVFAAGTVASGDCSAMGTGVTWVLDSAGKLTISGSGSVSDYALGSAPWYGYRGSIKSLVLGSDVDAIGTYAFAGCSALTSVSLPDGLRQIGLGAFRDCTGLAAVTIPGSVRTIGVDAFALCISLQSITLGEGVESINAGAFSGCAVRSVTLPASVTGASDAFPDCAYLTAINVASGNTNYSSDGGVLFNPDKSTLCQYPGGKQGSYAVPDSVTLIDSRAFQGCRKLTGVTLPDGLRSIGAQAFQGCSSLAAVTLPHDLTSIGARAFEGCGSLRTVELPYKLSTFGAAAFAGCSSLTSITVAAGNRNFTSESGVLYQYNGTRLLQYPAGKQGAFTVPDKVTEIMEGAFAACEGLTSLLLPDSVTVIGYDAFHGCSALRSLKLPASIKAIASQLFLDCTELRDVVIPGSVKSIGTAAFSGCNALEEVYFGGGSDAWDAISVYEDNAPLTDATVHYNAAGAPLRITGITADVSSAKVGDTVVWTAFASGGEGLLSYRCFIYLGSSIEYSDKDYSAANAISFRPVTPGTYRARVFVRDETGATVNQFSANLAVKEASAAPGAIASAAATAAPGKTTVTWSASEGATAYIIQRRVKDSASWTTLKSNVTGRSYVDTTGVAGTVYQYRVRGRDGTSYGPFKVTSVVRAQAASTAAAPGAIATVTAKAEAGKTTVTWSASSGAKAYIIQRRVKDSADWTTLKSNVTGLSYVDTTGVAGTVYQYRVRGRDGTNYGPFKVSSVVRVLAAK